MVASTQRASMPSECATNVGRYGLSPLIATPSTSAGVSPQSASARRAASVARPSAESATVPISAVSAAPTMATTGAHVRGARPEQRQRHLAERCERDLEREVERQPLGIGVDVDEVREQPRAFVELHLRDHVRRVEARRGAGG